MDPFIGEIRMVGFNFAPVGWAMCNGQVLSISQNDVLYTLLGTTYGGDGVNTFALPNLQGSVPIHQGTGPGGAVVMGQVSGVENVTLTVQQIPQHTHPINGNAAGSAASPANAYFAGDANQALYAPPDGTLTNTAIISVAGGSLPHSNMMPYGVITFIIALQGIFPSQN